MRTTVAVGVALLFVLGVDGVKADSSHTRHSIATAAASSVKADVIFAFDTTASMAGEIAAFQTSLSSSVIPQIRTTVPDVAFGLVDFRDFEAPITFTWVVKYRDRIQTVNTAAGVTSIQAGANGLSAAGGGDEPEAGWEAMYSIAGGPPISMTEYTSTFDLANTNPTSVTPGETQGAVGGAGFRVGAIPIVVAITDAEWHDAPGSGGLYPYPSTYNGVPSRAQAIARLNAIDARVISIVSPSAATTEDPRTQGRLLAEATGATVLPAAFGAVGQRPAGCGATQCCTGIGGAGEAPSSPGGTCPLVFRIADTGTGLANAITSGVAALISAFTPSPTSTMLASSANPAVPGQMVTLTATVTGSPADRGIPTGTVTFSDGATPLGTASLSTGQATFGTSTLPIGSHSITATYDGDSNFNGSTSAALTQTIQAIAAPAVVVATASSASHVTVSWTASSGAASYQILRSSSGNSYALIATSATLSFDDANVLPDTAYLYEVSAVDGSGGVSSPSPGDLATTVIFADDPLVANTTTIKAAHVTQLRTAVQAVRHLAGLQPKNFTDTTIDGTVTIQAIHLSELRDALGEARSALVLAPLTVTDATLVPGATPIKAAHFQEVRAGVK